MIIKGLEQFKSPNSPHTCALYSEYPSDTITIFINSSKFYNFVESKVNYFDYYKAFVFIGPSKISSIVLTIS